MWISTDRPVALAQLAAELQQALGLPEPPPLSGVPAGQAADDGTPIDGGVEAPDGLDEKRVRAVLDAHVPAASEKPPFLSALKAASTVSQLRDALVSHFER